MDEQTITCKLQEAQTFLEKGQVTEGVKILTEVGNFSPKTEEQVTILEYISVMLYD